MPNSQQFIDFVVEMMALSVIVKKMLGGKNLFVGSLTQQFCNLGLTRFSYKKRGETCYINYYQAPEVCFDDPEEMQHWAEAAFNVARVAAK
jgi:TfoX/Sxy family transcriptional regulator of competence genes